MVMFTDTFQKIARAMWPLLVVWLFKFNELNKVYLGLGFLVIIVLIGVVAYLQYWNFTFYIDDQSDEFIINKGILNKTKIAIQLHKIQQVNISQTLIQRIIGVHALDVDTAGSNKKEVSIRAISHDLAVALKIKLLSEVQTVSSENASDEITPITTEEPFIKISILSLIKVGITSNYVKTFGVLLAFVGTLYENFQNLLRNSESVQSMDTSKLDKLFDTNQIVYSVLMFILVIFVFILVINLGRTIIRYFDYKIARQNHSLLLSYGLLNTKNTILKPEKVQIITVSQNWLQKKMNVLNFKIKQASGSEDGREEKKSAIEIPGCNAQEKAEILRLIFNEIPEKGVMIKPNIRYLLFPVLFYIVLPVSLFLFFAFKVNQELFDYLFLLPVYLIFVCVMLFFSFKNYRLFVNQDYIIKQSGAWDIDNEIIEPHKIQSIKVSQLFWHKRLNIGSLRISTAGGDVTFHLGNFDSVKQLVNKWLYQVETTEKNWM